jgi:hypothetical protein
MASTTSAARAAAAITYTPGTLSGRGGASIAAVSGRPGGAGGSGSSSSSSSSSLWLFGGADRMGELYSDLHVAEPGPPLKLTPAALPTVAVAAFRTVHGNGEGREAAGGGDGAAPSSPSSADAPIPPLAGLASVALTVGGETRVVHYGGVNFVEERVYNVMLELRPDIVAGREAGGEGEGEGPLTPVSTPAQRACWRTLMPLDSATPGAKKNKGGPSVESSMRVEGDLPPGRTGHSLVVVPPPILLPAPTEEAKGDSSSFPAPVPLSSVPGGASPHSAECWLFGGSSPMEGPMNDIFRLTVSSGGGDGAGGAGTGEWRYSWKEVGTSGPAPAPRELHAAFVRPAVVQRVDESASAAAGSSSSLVRVLQPPTLIVFGGRNEDGGGAPRSDVCALDLMSMTWAAPSKAGFASAAGAFCQSPDGLTAFLFGGQNRASDITGNLLRMDLRCGLGGAEGSAPPAGPLEPATLRWEALDVHPKPSPRFAASAACTAGVLAAAAGGEAPATSVLSVHVFGGMTVESDLADLLTITVPVL